jgi:peptidoglycan/xylan/chitin deacetylase (PgdA/CDA1 family)
VTARLLLGPAAAWGAYAWGAHLLTPVLGLRRGGAGTRSVALTFDDGPDPDWTPRVLEILAARQVRGTFFLVGTRAARAPDTVRSIAAGGHEVASHGWCHRSLWLCGPRRTAIEVERNQDLLTGLTGVEPRLFRPPWGMVNAALFPILARHRLRCVFWSIQPEGLRPAPVESQVRHVIRRAHAGAIVDLHDAEGTAGAPARLCAALPSMIDGLRDAGYGFATVTALASRARPPR